MQCLDLSKNLFHIDVDSIIEIIIRINHNDLLEKYCDLQLMDKYSILVPISPHSYMTSNVSGFTRMAFRYLYNTLFNINNDYVNEIGGIIKDTNIFPESKIKFFVPSYVNKNKIYNSIEISLYEIENSIDFLIQFCTIYQMYRRHGQTKFSKNLLQFLESKKDETYLDINDVKRDEYLNESQFEHQKNFIQMNIEKIFITSF
jgi:hypothetical protein